MPIIDFCRRHLCSVSTDTKLVNDNQCTLEWRYRLQIIVNDCPVLVKLSRHVLGVRFLKHSVVQVHCITGPENPWLVSVYGKHALHPFASVIGEEIFQSGLVPGDTDFRIYRDFGGLSGMVALAAIVHQIAVV